MAIAIVFWMQYQWQYQYQLFVEYNTNCNTNTNCFWNAISMAIPIPIVCVIQYQWQYQYQFFFLCNFNINCNSNTFNCLRTNSNVQAINSYWNLPISIAIPRRNCCKHFHVHRPLVFMLISHDMSDLPSCDFDKNWSLTCAWLFYQSHMMVGKAYHEKLA